MNTKKRNSNKTIDYHQYLADTLESWGVTLFTGVTGGGVIHFLKHLKPFHGKPTGKPEFMTFAEYSAGFVPLGYYLASGNIAAGVATTGAASKLLSCGLSDAKMHDIPAIYILPISGKNTVGFSPLQDTSKYGINMLEQLQAELPDSVFFLDYESKLSEQFSLAKAQLDNSKPVVFVLDNEVMNVPFHEPNILPKNKYHIIEDNHFNRFISDFREATKNKRLVILVGEEMARYPEAKKLTSELCTHLKAATVWSINGANAISRDNPYGYGYISFGGNDKAMSLYKSIGKNDVLMILGACPDEYTVSTKKFKAGSTFYLSNIPQAYGTINSSIQHMAEGEYYQVHGPLDSLLKAVINASKEEPFKNKPGKPAPENLNDTPFNKPSKDHVDMAEFYLKMDKWWPADSIGIDDVCLSYKDKQYVTQRPNDNIRFYSLYRGSAMGGAFGVTVGAKLAKPDSNVFLFTGDGCFRLFSGSLGEVRDLGIVMFVLNNETLSIVEQGLEIVLPDIPEENYHAWLKSVDYCGVAKACGWDAEKLKPNMSNLDSLLKKIDKGLTRSLLIEIPVDPFQFLGSNPRLKNL
jgi:Thiamine pyrophosphate-requiring enzymes [acetolactate synthase, pyruvate dehydrogenase (cytochrome), glyoxylate carboligase, phosphonopyruvate decarboxylase]